jgi:hypothetical protein
MALKLSSRTLIPPNLTIVTVEANRINAQRSVTASEVEVNVNLIIPVYPGLPPVDAEGSVILNSADGLVYKSDGLAWSSVVGIVAGDGLDMVGNTVSIDAPLALTYGGTGISVVPTTGQIMATSSPGTTTWATVSEAGELAVPANNTVYGIDAGLNLAVGDTENCFIGISAGRNSSLTNNNVCVGYNSGYNLTGDNNIFIGVNSGTNTSLNPTSNGIYIGSNAGGISTANGTIAIGRVAGQECTAPNNIYIGNDCADNATTGERNVFMGAEAGRSTTNGSNLVYVGYRAGEGATGSNNIGIGRSARITFGNSSSVALGARTITSNSRTVVVGDRTVVVSDLGGIAIGTEAEARGIGAVRLGDRARGGTGGTGSIAIGLFSGGNNDYAIAIGNSAGVAGLRGIGIGRIASCNGDYGVGVGYGAACNFDRGICLGSNAVCNTVDRFRLSDVITSIMSTGLGGNAGGGVWRPLIFDTATGEILYQV